MPEAARRVPGMQCFLCEAECIFTRWSARFIGIFRCRCLTLLVASWDAGERYSPYSCDKHMEHIDLLRSTAHTQPHLKTMLGAGTRGCCAALLCALRETQEQHRVTCAVAHPKKNETMTPQGVPLHCREDCRPWPKPKAKACRIVRERGVMSLVGVSSQRHARRRRSGSGDG